MTNDKKDTYKGPLIVVIVLLAVIGIVAVVMTVPSIHIASAEKTPLSLDKNSTTIDEDSTVVFINGTTSNNSNVSISSNDVDIGTKYPKIDNNGNFYYYIKISKSLKNAVFIVEATEEGKETSIVNFTMTRAEPKTEEVKAIVKYIGNSDSLKFHYPSCEWAKKISSGNLVEFENRTEAINKGYDPCKVCKP